MQTALALSTAWRQGLTGSPNGALWNARGFPPDIRRRVKAAPKIGENLDRHSSVDAAGIDELSVSGAGY